MAVWERAWQHRYFLPVATCFMHMPQVLHAEVEQVEASLAAKQRVHASTEAQLVEVRDELQRLQEQLDSTQGLLL